MQLPSSDTEAELKKHLRQATFMVANIGSALGMRSDKDSQMFAGMLVEVMEHLQEATTKFSELRN